MLLLWQGGIGFLQHMQLFGIGGGFRPILHIDAVARLALLFYAVPKFLAPTFLTLPGKSGVLLSLP